MKLIYCVEDDASIRELIVCALKTADFEIEGYEDYQGLSESMKRRVPDLILLDIMVPKTDGFAMLKLIKQDPSYRSIPVIMLTAKSMEIDKVKCLEGGADDYITKPFGILELIARIKAVLRRSAGTSDQQSIMEFNKLVLDYGRRTLRYDNNLIDLTYKEFELLNYLMINKGIVLSRDKILQQVWGFDYEGETRTVDMHIKSIRQKLEEIGCPGFIKTVRGAGYKFEEMDA